MPSFVKRPKKTENPAGGVNPALEPNVGQYGWTSYDAASVNQLIQYVDECKKYAEIAKGAADYIETKFDDLKDLITYLEAVYDKIKPLADEIEKIEISVTKMHTEVMIARVEVDLDRIEAGKSAAGAKLSEETAVEAATSAFRSKLSAKDSEDQSLIYLEESRGLAEELRAGQVYRGTWNPKTGAYPDNGGTNSVWDVILDAGTSDIVFEGFTWHAGDRLLYIVAETKYDQLKTGSGVLSVNGKAGAVTLTAADVAALPIVGGTLTGNLIAPNYFFRDDDSVLFDNAGNPVVQTTKTYGSNLFGNRNTTTYIVYKDTLYARDKNNMDYQIYHEGRKPSPQELGAVPDTATINGKPVNTNPTITLAELGGYPATGGNLSGPMVSRDVVRINSTANPIMELHAEGTTAAMLWIDKSTSNLNLSRSNGSSSEASRLMDFNGNGIAKFFNTVETTTAISARSQNGQKFIDLEAHDTGSPYISYDPADGGGPRVGMYFTTNEVLANRRVACDEFRVGTDGGLRFSPYGDFGGVSWGMGLNASNGFLGIHQYQDGVWQQAPLQFLPFEREIRISNTLRTGLHQIRVPNGQIPAQEFLVEGAHAAMWYLNPQSGSLHLATTSGNFDALQDRIIITSPGDIQAGGKVTTTAYTGRGWGSSGVSAFYQYENIVGDGSLVGLISGWRHFPGFWAMEMGYGHISSTDPNVSGHTFFSNDGATYGRNWVMRNNGMLEAPSGWFIDPSGNLAGSVFGGAYITTWVSTYFQPISDEKFKENIRPSTKSALDDVRQIQFKAFDWKAGHDVTANRDNVEIGIIAQELEAIDNSYTLDVPTVDKDGNPDGHNKGLDTANLLALALKAIQEQSELIQALEARIEVLEGRP